MNEGYHIFSKIHCLWFYRFVRNTMSYLNAEKYLEWRCTDWRIQKSDFGRGRICEFRYMVEAYSFPAKGTGLGKTAMQAAKRAVKQMLRDRKKLCWYDGSFELKDLDFEVK